MPIKYSLFGSMLVVVLLKLSFFCQIAPRGLGSRAKAARIGNTTKALASPLPHLRATRMSHNMRSTLTLLMGLMSFWLSAMLQGRAQSLPQLQ